jgi:hypothetical protein
MFRKMLVVPLLLVAACQEPTTPGIETQRGALHAPSPVPPALTEYLWGSSSLGTTNPGSIFTIDTSTATATLVGTPDIPEGDTRISAIDFDPISETLYGIKGGPCYGALLITIDPTTGAGTLVDTLKGAWFDGTPGPSCPGGSAAIAFAPDGTLYASGWYGGTPQGKIMKVDKETAEVLEVYPTPLGYDDWRGRRAHLNGLAFDRNGKLWASRGNSVDSAQINTVDPTTGDITGVLRLNDPVMEDSVTISDLAFAPDGRLYGSLPWEGQLAVIDTATGDVTRIGPFGAAVSKISGLASVPWQLQALLGRYWFNEAASGTGPTTVYDDQINPVDLTIAYSSMEWVLLDGSRGLRSNAFSHNGKVMGNAASTKYQTALSFTSQTTLVYVVSLFVPPYVQAVGGFQNYHPNTPERVAWLQTNTSGNPSVVFRTEAQAGLEVGWSTTYLADTTRHVVHVVYDTDDAVSQRRIRLYVDGVDQGYGAVSSGSWPAAGEGLDMSSVKLELQLMNFIEKSGSTPMGGTVLYFAVYETALSDPFIAANAAALLAGDDGPP